MLYCYFVQAKSLISILTLEFRLELIPTITARILSGFNRPSGSLGEEGSQILLWNMALTRRGCREPPQGTNTTGTPVAYERT